MDCQFECICETAPFTTGIEFRVTLLKRSALSILVAATAGTVFAASTATATPSAGFTGTTLAKATFGPISSQVRIVSPNWKESLKTKGLSDLYVQQNTWQPGGSTGWHTHPGPSLVIVTQGTVTVYDGDDPTCTPHAYSAGSSNNSFVDEGDGHVHIVRNETAAPAQTIAVQLVPSTADRRQDAANPGHCPF